MAKKSKVTKITDAPKKRGRKPKVVVNLPQTHGPNGSSGAGRMELADEDDLGPLELPTGDDAVRVLQELAGLQGQRYRANKDLERLQASTKKAKATVEGFDARISELIQTSTRKSDLPLFEREQAEADIARIQEQAEAECGELGAEGTRAANLHCKLPIGHEGAHQFDRDVTSESVMASQGAPEVAPLALPDAQAPAVKDFEAF